jgi:hypothetical protein
LRRLKRFHWHRAITITVVFCQLFLQFYYAGVGLVGANGGNTQSATSYSPSAIAIGLEAVSNFFQESIAPLFNPSYNNVEINLDLPESYTVVSPTAVPDALADDLIDAANERDPNALGDTSCANCVSADTRRQSHVSVNGIEVTTGTYEYTQSDIALIDQGVVIDFYRSYQGYAGEYYDHDGIIKDVLPSWILLPFPLRFSDYAPFSDIDPATENDAVWNTGRRSGGTNNVAFLPANRWAISDVDLAQYNDSLEHKSAFPHHWRHNYETYIEPAICERPVGSVLRGTFTDVIVTTQTLFHIQYRR